MQLTVQDINTKIYTIRNTKVMLDSDLAELYDVLTKNLNKAVTRNIKRFPSDFMFQLTKEELEDLRFQIGTTKLSMTRTMPRVFTEQGVSMLSSVLRSDTAVDVNIQISASPTVNVSDTAADPAKSLSTVSVASQSSLAVVFFN